LIWSAHPGAALQAQSHAASSADPQVRIRATEQGGVVLGARLFEGSFSSARMGDRRRLVTAFGAAHCEPGKASAPFSLLLDNHLVCRVHAALSPLKCDRVIAFARQALT
jgi:hypothetical protein